MLSLKSGFLLILLLLPLGGLSALEKDAGWERLPLLDSQGKKRQLEEFRGKLLLINFVFSSCSSICPPQTASLAQLQRKLKPEDKKHLRFVSVSIDPEHDTPAELRAYMQRFSIDESSWIFLTGDNAPILAGYFGSLSPSRKPLEHGGRLYLISPDGRFLMSYAGIPVDEKRLEKELPAAIAAFHVPQGLPNRSN